MARPRPVPPPVTRATGAREEARRRRPPVRELVTTGAFSPDTNTRRVPSATARRTSSDARSEGVPRKTGEGTLTARGPRPIGARGVSERSPLTARGSSSWGLPVLVERVFVLGGAVCLLMGGTLVGAFAWTGLLYFELLYSGGLSAGFGVLFLYVGKEAGRQRLELLKLGESGDPNSRLPPGP